MVDFFKSQRACMAPQLKLPTRDLALVSTKGNVFLKIVPVPSFYFAQKLALWLLAIA